MLFNSPDFIIFFVVVLTIIVIIKHRKFQQLFLLAVSYFFFYYTSNYLITLLIFSTILDYYIAKQIFETHEQQKKKILLIISLAGNLGLLGFYKYADFSISQFNIMFSYLNLDSIPFFELILPIGISFYTFQTISYTVDVYRGNLTPSKTFWEFALFVSFFPQLVAGPIVRAKDFLPQLREKIANSKLGSLKLIQIRKSNLKLGITIMSLGFLKKMFFADNIAPLVSEVFTDPIGRESFTIIIGAIAFGIQIYGDFSGYSDIAIGAALVLGFQFPLNFNKPYFATSPSDFWRRWHISLSSWLRDYLYIPLGGNKKSEKRTYANLLIVMLLGGLWHGAAVNFLIWGALHGLYLGIHRVITDAFPSLKNHLFFKSKLGIVISILITQYFVFLAWIPFRVRDINDVLYSMEKYIVWDFAFEETIIFMSSQKFPIALMVGFFILNFISYKNKEINQKISGLRIPIWAAYITVVMLLILLFYTGSPEDFIYFQF